MTNRFAGRLALILTAALVLSIGAPLFAADKTASPPVSISTVTDSMGSVNINVGKGEGIKEGSKGVVIRDGKEIASYVVQQVNWGFSRITLLNVAEGYTVRPGDSAPFSEAPKEKPSVKKKSSTVKTVLTILAVGAAIYLLAGGGGGGDSSEVGGDIAITTQKTSTSSPGSTTGTISITASVNDETGFPAPDGTAVTFSSTAGTLNRTQTTTSAGRATATLSYDLSVDPEVATVTVRALGKTAAKVLSFVSSIDVVADPLTIEAKDTGTGESAATITATCLDASGSPATTGSVTFTSNLGNIATASVPIGAGGIATTTFSSNTAGTATVTATWGSSRATATITVTPGPPFSISVASDTNSIQADGNSSAVISATVKNVKGNSAMDGTVVNFSVIPDGKGTITPQATTVNGVATAYLYSRDSDGNPSTSGTATIKAEVLRANQPPDVPLPATDLANQSVTVQFVSPEVAVIELNAQPIRIRGWNTSGNESTITAVVRNIDGQSVPDGTAVYFTATQGIITGGVSGNMSRTSGGRATATLKALASWYGQADVTATSGTISETAVGLVTFLGPPSQVNSTATISPDTIYATNDQALVTVTVQDVNDERVADGTKVTVRTNKGTFIGGLTAEGSTVNGEVVFALATSTNDSSPTSPGLGTVTVNVESVSFALNFTVIARPAP